MSGPGQMKRERSVLPGMIGPYRPEKKLGSGQFGTCYEVADTSHGDRPLVLKQVFCGMLAADEQTDAMKEAKLLAELSHPNVLKFHDAFIHDRQFVCIITELCRDGDLSMVIERTKFSGEQLSEAHIMKWFVQLVLALQYLHNRKVLHRDVKTKNVFLNCGVVKLGDFGIARVLMSSADQASTLAGTPYYMSPESLAGLGYNAKSDIWALGCIVYELCLLKMAFDGDNLLGLTYKICEGNLPELPDRYSKELAQVAHELLVRTPSERPSADTLLMNPYIRKHAGALDIALSKTLIERDHSNIVEAVPEMMGKEHRIAKSKKRGGGRRSPNATGGSGGSTLEGSGRSAPWEKPGQTNAERIKAKKIYMADQRGKEVRNAAGEGVMQRSLAREEFKARDQGDGVTHLLGTTQASYGREGSNMSSHSSRSRERSNLSGKSREQSDLSTGSRHSRYSNGSHGSGGVGRAKPTEPSWISEHPDVFPHGTPADTYNSRLGDTGYSYSDSYYSQSGNSGQLGTTMSMHEVDAYRSVIADSLRGTQDAPASGGGMAADPPLRSFSTEVKGKAVQRLGKENYERAYKFARKARKNDTPDEEIQTFFAQLVNNDKAMLRECNNVDQLVFHEIMAGKTQKLKGRTRASRDLGSSHDSRGWSPRPGGRNGGGDLPKKGYSLPVQSGGGKALPSRSRLVDMEDQKSKSCAIL